MAPAPSRSGSGLNTLHYQSYQKLPIAFTLNSQIPVCAGMTGFFIPDSSAEGVGLQPSEATDKHERRRQCSKTLK